MTDAKEVNYIEERQVENSAQFVQHIGPCYSS